LRAAWADLQGAHVHVEGGSPVLLENDQPIAFVVKRLEPSGVREGLTFGRALPPEEGGDIVMERMFGATCDASPVGATKRKTKKKKKKTAKTKKKTVRR